MNDSIEDKMMSFMQSLTVDELVTVTQLALTAANIGLTISLLKKVDTMSGSLNQDVADLTAGVNQLVAGQQTEAQSIQDAANEIHTLLSQNQVDPAVRTAIQNATQKILGSVSTMNDNNVKLQSAMSEVVAAGGSGGATGPTGGTSGGDTGATGATGSTTPTDPNAPPAARR